MNYQTISDVNVRLEPDTQSEILDTLLKGDVVTGPSWIPIFMEDESIGWVLSKYLKSVEEIPKEVVILPISKITGTKIVTKAMTQNKDPYIFGYEVDLNDSNPKAFDCSELTQWVCAQLGIKPIMPDGAGNQYLHCKEYNTLISIAEAVRTPGALLFRITDSGDHVVISRGDGSTIEAKGSAYGVGVFSTVNRGWNYAAKIPGVVYT